MLVLGDIFGQLSTNASWVAGRMGFYLDDELLKDNLNWLLMEDLEDWGPAFITRAERIEENRQLRERQEKYAAAREAFAKRRGWR